MSGAIARRWETTATRVLTWSVVAALPWLLIHLVESQTPGSVPALGVVSLFYVLAAAVFSYTAMIRQQQEITPLPFGTVRIANAYEHRYKQNTTLAVVSLAVLLTVASIVPSVRLQHQLVFASYVLNLANSLRITQGLWQFPSHLHPKENGRVAQVAAFFILTGVACFVILFALQMLTDYRLPGR